MSGSGGEIGGAPDSSTNCEELVIVTQISSPKQNVVEKLHVGDILEIKLISENDLSIVTVIHKDEVVGGVVHLDVAQLRKCLNDGFLFNAEIITIDEGQVRIRIEPNN